MLDAYMIRARIAPALLAGLPAVALAGASAFTSASGIRITGLVLGAAGIALAGLIRDAGRRLQETLWRGWGGGNPTARRLRWRDAAAPDTVARLHRRLNRLLDEPLPDAAAEAEDPARADSAYEDAVATLRNLTRDRDRFNLIFEENVEYGFRRNSLGTRPAAIAVSLGTIVVSAALFAVDGAAYTSRAARWGGVAVVSVAALIFWSRFVTPDWVRRASDVYADRLLEAADTLARPPESQT
ncbi:MAG TPA: hypothetical protein VF230_16520 [Acidimicrobiales bacterium]